MPIALRTVRDCLFSLLLIAMVSVCSETRLIPWVRGKVAHHLALPWRWHGWPRHGTSMSYHESCHDKLMALRWAVDVVNVHEITYWYIS